MAAPLTRREFIALSAATSMGVLAACGSDDDGGAVLSSSQAVREREPAAGTAADVTAEYRARPLELDLAGRVASTWGYSDSVPGKLLRARAGDVVEVTVANELPEATSIHWHGLAIVNSMDGVPGLTQGDIAVGSRFTYRFTVPDPGTYWFHPHHGLQLERGLYAPFIIDDPDENMDYDEEYVLILDDWIDGVGSSPEQELARIRAAGAAMDPENMDHGDMEMASSPLLGGDAGDAVYTYHLVNGRPLGDPLTLEPRPRPGARIRIRLINAGGDTAYRFAIGGHRLTVTHADGFPVDPVTVDALLIGMGERYDVVVDVQSGAWPIVALAEGKQDRAAAVLRSADASEASPPDLTADVRELDGEWLRYASLKAAGAAILALPDTKIREHVVRLTGGMAAFDWSIDDRRFGDHRPIEVETDEWISLVFENASDMWHPMHIHGHTPQLTGLPGGVRKDTVNVLPGDSVTMTFQATNPGQWMVHCHNAYHLESGMATVLSYVG